MIAEKQARLNRALLIVPLAPLLWAGNAVLARGLVGQIPPVALAFFRWSLAALIVLPFAFRPMRDDWPAVRQQFPFMVLLSFLSVSAFNTVYYIALQTTTALNASIVQTGLPAITLLLMFLFFRERVTPVQLGGIALAASGATFIILRGNLANLIALDFVIGDLLTLLAVTLYALYSALLRRRRPMSDVGFLGWTFVMGAVVIVPFYLVELGMVGGFRPTPTVLSGILYVAVGPSIIGYLCWNYGIDRIGASRTSLFINLLPLFAAVLSIIFLDEAPRLFHVIGFALVMTGLWVFNRPTDRAASF